MHFYAGMGLALKVRLDACAARIAPWRTRASRRAPNFLRALELDPQMADATGGLGLYNYYVDSLSTIVKFLRFFMGIPGGNKTEGIRQMQIRDRTRGADARGNAFLSREESAHVRLSNYERAIAGRPASRGALSE